MTDQRGGEQRWPEKEAEKKYIIDIIEGLP